MDLQNAFYIIGIIFMSVMLILIIALVVAIFAIRAKIVAIHRQIDEKLDAITGLASAGGKIVSSVGSSIKGAWTSHKPKK